MSDGLRIERRFTKAGTDPYDLIEWSRRDSRIANPDGSVVFEMTDADIPTGWSQVAADIMVSKYFRKAGVAQRDENGEVVYDDNGDVVTGPERSARQVFDRLATTWRHWGEVGGYFASDDDAQAFEDELKYMLATQMAAPNSPQWFNTGLFHSYGITGPAQGFWYVDPESEELVSSPDSYSRPSPHACFPAGTKVTTRNGLKAIEEIEIGDEVLTHLGRWQPVVETMSRTADGLVRVVMEGHESLEATGNHPILTMRHGRTDWLAAGDLRPGDLVIVEPSPREHSNEEGEPYDPGVIGHTAPVLGLEDVPFVGTVFNLQIDEDESYVAHGVIVHNCFILGVSDDLVNPGGIMDLWTREARIFKFGSGAGSNFSAIRAENELLSGGGKSSGVMSFLKIGDRAAGAIKCLHADTEIVTGAGTMPIRSIEPGNTVTTRFGQRRVSAVHDNGVRTLVKITTALGDEILATPEHRFWVRTSQGEQWREAGELTDGDHVLVDLSTSPTGTVQALKTVEAGHHNEISHDLPSELNEPVALWLGWVMGDGSVTSRPGAKYVAVQIGDKDPELIGRYTSIVKGIFGAPAHVYVSRRGEERPDASASVRISSSQIIRFLEINGLRKGKAADAAMPQLIKSSPPGVRAAFLSGLFEADGHIDNGYPVLSTISRTLALDVHRLLLSLGIPSTIKTQHNRAGALGSRAIHLVRVVGGEGVLRFSKLVGFISQRKDEQLAAAVGRKTSSPYETQWILPHVAAELNELWGAGSPALRRALAPYCRYQAPRSLSLLRAKALVARFPEELAGTSIERFAMGNAYYQTVTVEPAADGPVFDLTVEGVHEYSVHGIVTHNSGGTTRRAAKMVILDVDHPDIESFVDWKKVEEDKARLLIQHGGYPADFNGEAYATVSGQNSNNSVRVSNEFIEAVLADGDWELKERTTGKVRRTIKARDLWSRIAEAAWSCADPGLQFDTTINEWHTSPAGGRINASNPCFTGEIRVATDKGLIPFKSLVTRVADGESFQVYTHDATGGTPSETIDITSPSQVMVTGTNQILRLDFTDGRVLRCTPNHRLWTSDRGWVRADEVTEDDRVRLLDQDVDFGMASWSIPVSTDARSYQRQSSRTYAVDLPEKWTEELAHYLGWLVGDGAMTSAAAVTVYGTAEEQQTIMLAHRQLLTELNGGEAPKPVAMANGTYQLRVTRGAIRKFFQALGVSPVKAGDNRVPWSIFEAPKPIVASFLRGLYDADGCVSWTEKNRYVGLGSKSTELLRDAQQLLDTFGVHGAIYEVRQSSSAGFEYTTVGGEHRTYAVGPFRDLRISGTAVERFAAAIGFEVDAKANTLARMLEETGRYATKYTARLRRRSDDGWETTYNLTEPKNHSYLAGGVLVSNCSEYMFLDDTACNLASLNLVKFETLDGGFDIDGYRHAVRIWTIVLEISVTMAHFPSPEIAQGSYDYRTLGLGYANLGSLLMRQGIAYDSDQGRAIAGAMTAILTGQSYATSAEMAGVVGPFPKYSENAEAMLRVIRNHRRAAYNDPDFEDISHKVLGIDSTLVPADIIAAARQSWDEALELGEVNGFRNAQASVLAPTGCLIGGSLVPTDRGLVRLRSLGDPQGPEWQKLDIDVSTDEGARKATQFYVNGVEPVVTVETARGYRIQGTPTHRIKVVEANGSWVWKRFGDMQPEDLVPLQMDKLVGEPQVVTLPPLGEMHWTSDFTTRVPRIMTADLAEFVGYFMGDGFLHSKGIRLAVAAEDFDVVERLSTLGKELFGLEAHVTEQVGYTEVALHSVPLTVWWEACGFAKHAPKEGHTGKGWHPHIPDSVLASNDREVYHAFLRGLFEADGTVHQGGYPSWSTTSVDFSHDVQTLLLALGIPTTRKFDTPGWGSSPLAVLRVLNLAYCDAYAQRIGFMSGRKQGALRPTDVRQGSRGDYIPAPRALVDRLAPDNDHLRKTMLMALNRIGLVSRRSAEMLLQRTGDAELAELLGFFYDRTVSAELGDEEWTYDLSVPDNVTYVANGFVSHNTIGLLMDCDTTGVEPDFSLVKFKKLAGGGYFKIANQSVAPALRHLGYTEDEISEIVTSIVGTSSLAGAPHVNRVSLEEKGFTPEEIDAFQKALPSVFELRHAFNVFSVGEAALQRLGFTVDEYTAWDFDLLAALGFSRSQIQEANDHICGRQTIEGAPHLRDEHLSVFDTANRNGRYGQRFIHHIGHIRMMAAAQPFISGAISKTINMPAEVTPEDIEGAYRMSWELGLKAMALYRDGSKAAQPLNSTSDEGGSDEEDEAVTQAMEAEAKIHWGNIPTGLSPSQAYAQGMKPPRFLLPARRSGYNQEARVGGHKVFVRTGEYDDGTLGEIFIDLAKEGATLKGILSCFAIAVSKGLQYGVPLEEFVDTFTFQTFEPRGMVEGHPNIKMANSIIDYVFRSLGVEYLERDDLAQVPPNREMELPEPKTGLAAEAGYQLELNDAAAESDVDAVQAAARFADDPNSGAPRTASPAPAPQKIPASVASVDAGTASMQAVLGDMMGDAPLCDTCGHITVRNGSCYKCLNCGNSLGCS